MMTVKRQLEQREKLKLGREQVGMRNFHLIKHGKVIPIINVERLWSATCALLTMLPSITVFEHHERH